MPPHASSRSRQLVIGGLSVSQIQNFIPKIWKKQQPVEQPARQTDESMSDAMTSCSPVASLIKLTKQGRLSDAFKSFSRIIIDGASYDDIVHSIHALCISCTNVKNLPVGRQLHTRVISLDLERNSSIAARLVCLYCSFSMFRDAHFVVERCSLCTLDTFPWNTLISSYVKNGLSKEGLNAYKEMVSKGILPDRFTYPSVLKACGEESDLGFGREVHKRIIKRRSVDGWSLFVQNALIAMYGRFGELRVARRLFDEMPERDLVSWNTIISLYASKGMWEEAFVLFENMRMENVEVGIIIWNTIAGGCLRSSNFKGVLDLLSQMTTCGVSLDNVAMIIGLSACSHIGDIRLGKQIHAASIRSYFDGINYVRNALITMYSRCNDLRHASILFHRGEDKSISTWNAMISGYAHIDQSEETSFIFREMLASGFEPNYVTIASILPLCARVANLQHGKEFHCYIIRREGFKDYLLLWNALVDMYARSGKLYIAKRLFDSMSRRDEVTYTSLIAGYGIQGEGEAALALFEEMIEGGIKPDHVTMVAVLSACSHSRLVTQGQLLFHKMVSAYGLIPQSQHYACLVDLFGRAGLLNKAKQVLMGMPYRPSIHMWATLLGACRIHGNTEIGEWAAEKLLEMKPQNSGYYVLIANMYAAAGCWDKLAQVRTFMRDMGVRKDPGCAWVDVGTGFSPFLVEDTKNPQSDQIYPLLEGLTQHTKDAGYVPGEDVNMENTAIEGKLTAAG